MNVQEALLQERIDPALTDTALSALARRSAKTGAGEGASAEEATTHRREGIGGHADEPTGVRGYHVLTGGCWNRVIGVRDGARDLVFKISPHADDEKIIREFAVLTVFADRTDLSVPRALCLDRGETLPGTTLVMSRIPGHVMHERFGYLGRKERELITDQIAEDISELHHQRGRGFGGVELPEEARHRHWPDFWLPRFDAVIRESGRSGVVPEALLAGAAEIRPELPSVLEIGRESTLTHYDLWSGNVMIDVDSPSPRVSGYIDVPGFYADYARELSFAMLFGVADRRFFSTYLRHHSLDPDFELRANIYNLKMNIRHIQMYPSEGFYRRGAEENLRFIRHRL